MFKKGKTYKTVAGNPARILWKFTQGMSKDCMIVLHYAYTKKENVLFHKPDGQFSELVDEYNLTEEEYDS